MSRIGEELAKITEGIGGEPTGTSDAALEIKRIIKALDPDASTDGGTLENVVKIRELVEDGKGGGGSSNDALLKLTTNSDGYFDLYYGGTTNEAEDDTTAVCYAMNPILSGSINDESEYGVTRFYTPNIEGTLASISNGGFASWMNAMNPTHVYIPEGANLGPQAVFTQSSSPSLKYIYVPAGVEITSDMLRLDDNVSNDVIVEVGFLESDIPYDTQIMPANQMQFVRFGVPAPTIVPEGAEGCTMFKEIVLGPGDISLGPDTGTLI